MVGLTQDQTEYSVELYGVDIQLLIEINYIVGLGLIIDQSIIISVDL